jgi:hypothetical protein
MVSAAGSAAPVKSATAKTRPGSRDFKRGDQGLAGSFLAKSKDTCGTFSAPGVAAK